MIQGAVMMISNRNDGAASHEYPTWIGFIFIFNLIVGTGALTLPAVFARAGWMLSLVVVASLAAISYMTVTFIIEAMACANAVRNWQNLQVDNDSNGNGEDTDDVTESLLVHAQPTRYLYYRLDDKFELGEMAGIFFTDIGRILFYLCIAIYLYGDMSIYSAAVATSLRDIVCDGKKGTSLGSLALFDYAARNGIDEDGGAKCWQQHTMSRLSVYRLFLIGFTFVFGPFAAFSVQKTKYLQILTAVFRWLAFTFMISIAAKLLITEGIKGYPPAANINGLPSLFGACVYSFMCHHSLPSLLAPIRNKHSLRSILAWDYVLICLFYVLLAMTGIFAFAHLEDLYTLNFIPVTTTNHSFQVKVLIAIDYFLALFPVFTLSASFPIIAITLRNNLQTLFLDMTRFETYNCFVRRMLFPLCAVLPPFVITYFTQNLTSLVAFTGSYAGAGIQYLIPISLVYFARRTCTELLGNGVVNEFRSPFRSINWLLFVLIWALACMCLVTVNFFLNPKATA